VKLKITVENKTYEVEVEATAPEVETAPPRGYVVQSSPLRVPASAPTVGAPPAVGDAASEAKICRSPISGMVVKISAQPRQSIQAGDVLFVLEAMKMETNITAPIAGKIARVNVNVGDSVQGGQVLVDFE
jgi:biotin carboxyl carrier protein